MSVEQDFVKDEKFAYFKLLDNLRDKVPLEEGDVTYPSDFDLVPKDWENFQKSFDKVNALHEIRKHYEVIDGYPDNETCCTRLRYVFNEHLAKKDKMICTHLDVASVFLQAHEDLYLKESKTEDIYKYDIRTRLWTLCSTSQLKGAIIHFMSVYVEQFDHRRPVNRDAFDDDEWENIKDYTETMNKYKRYVRSDSTINGIVNVFKSIMPSTDTKFDRDLRYFDVLAFQNGNLNVKTNEFTPRSRFDHMTMCLGFSYSTERDAVAYNAIHDFFCKIQPTEAQRHFTVQYLKYCLSGGNPEQIMKMNIGYSAANGKSTELDMHEKVFDIYTYKLHRDTFNKNCNKLHKYLSKCITHPIRLAYINELDENKLDHQFLKDLIDCKSLELEKLYSTMTEESTLQCNLITTSNNDPNVTADKGLMRRIAIQHYESQFVEPEDVNEESHKYLKNKYYLQKFDDPAYKLAYVHYLLDADSLRIPEENQNLVTTVLEENDEIFSVLSEHFEITGNPEDKVPHTDVQAFFPEKKIQQLNRELKRFNVMYDKNLRVGGTRKVYKGLKALPDDPE